ncbi:MAG TPA: RNA methyltransferase [Terracidiphilus sp.]|jgi:TrmH family RNA methyltransferase|nr:RNA methyltransferase [Terracidiphilus sp.]
MPVRIVQSKQNARLKELRRALIRPGRETHGLAGIEGINLVEEALDAELNVPCVFVAREAEGSLKGLSIPPSTEVILIERKLLNTALATETPQPVAALVEVPDWTMAHILGPGKRTAPLVVVLAGVQDPGNLGTIVRSAEAFGASGILSLPGTVSAWNPKAVRASAGSVFRMPLIPTTESECFAALRQAGTHILATTVYAAQPADTANLTGAVAFLIGNEGSGVPENLAAHADASVTIPCPGAVESLNAAVAASVLLYEASRQRLWASGGPRELRGSLR